MSQTLERYLDRVMIYANRSQADARKIRAELKDHLLNKIEDLQAAGVKQDDAVLQAIEAYGKARNIGYGLRPRFPWIDVRTRGTARGFIAIGPKAIGVIAFGGIACGIVSYGVLATGIWSFGVFAIGLMTAMGYLAFSPAWAYGAIAIGLMGTMQLGAQLSLTSIKGSNFAVNFVVASWAYAVSMLTILFSGIITLIIQLLMFLSGRKRRGVIQADLSLVE